MYAASHPVPSQESLKAAADLINRGSKVAILAGAGCLKARNEILKLAEKLGAPIIKPLLGKAVVPDKSLYTTGGIGLLGTAPSQDALKACETLIIAGSGFPYLEFYAETWSGEDRSDRYRSGEDWTTPCGRCGTHRGVQSGAASLIALNQQKGRSKLLAQSPRQYEEMERAHSRAWDT